MQAINSHSDPPNWNQVSEIVALSASNRENLKKQLLDLKNQLLMNSATSELCLLAKEFRNSFQSKEPCRLLIVIESNEISVDLIDAAINGIESHMEANWSEKSFFYGENRDCGKLAFVFPGQGSQYVGMGKDLIKCFPEAKTTLATAEAFFEGTESLSKFIYPEALDREEEGSSNDNRLRATDVAQPAIGAVCLAMIRILERFGIKPDSACGHSYGELSALFSSGRISETTFLKLSVARGKFMAQAGKGKDTGTMLAVKAPLDQINALLKTSQTEVILANKNSPDQGVLSGPTEEIHKIKDLFKNHKIRTTLLPVAAAFHSSLVSDAAEPFRQTLAQFDFHPPSIPVYSNTTGAPYPDSSQAAKEILGRHLLNPVNFADEIELMHKGGCRIFLEVGPKSVLTGLVKSILEGKNFFAIAVDGSSGKKSGMADLAKVLCHLSSIGYPVDLARWRKS
jgi:malonyl CoA-acyl carrier protein transacylase